MDTIYSLKKSLENKIVGSKKVFLLGHNEPDFDSIGSCIGLSVLASYFGVKSYIIVNDDYTRIQPGVKKIIDENEDRFKFIKNDDFYSFFDEDSLIIICDVNKKNMVSINLDNVSSDSIFVIDHHSVDDNTIKTKNIFINIQSSSACEIVAQLLNSFKIKYDNRIADYLLLGISLDTKRFKQNTTSKTHDVAEKLIDNGADIDFVNNLFLEEFESFCRISNLIINGTVIEKYSDDLIAPIQISFTLNRNNPKEIYIKEDYAKAADRMMKFYGIDAAFTLGYIDSDTIHISARGGKKVDVLKIISKLGGGGNSQSAGAKIVSDDIFSVLEELQDSIIYGISDKEDIYDSPKIIKVKK